MLVWAGLLQRLGWRCHRQKLLENQWPDMDCMHSKQGLMHYDDLIVGGHAGTFTNSRVLMQQ